MRLVCVQLFLYSFIELLSRCYFSYFLWLFLLLDRYAVTWEVCEPGCFVVEGGCRWLFSAVAVPPYRAALCFFFQCMDHFSPDFFVIGSGKCFQVGRPTFSPSVRPLACRPVADCHEYGAGSAWCTRRFSFSRSMWTAQRRRHARIQAMMSNDVVSTVASSLFVFPVMWESIYALAPFRRLHASSFRSQASAPYVIMLQHAEIQSEL